MERARFPGHRGTVHRWNRRGLRGPCCFRVPGLADAHAYGHLDADVDANADQYPYAYIHPYANAYIHPHTDTDVHADTNTYPNPDADACAATPVGGGCASGRRRHPELA